MENRVPTWEGDWTWLERPSFPYCYAFDLCAVASRRSGGPVGVLVSGPFYAREILKRLDGDVILRPLGDWDPRNPASMAEMGPEVRWGQVSLEEGKGASDDLDVVIWAEPERDDTSQVRDYLVARLKPGGRLIVVISNWLRLALPEWRGSTQLPARHPLGVARTLRLLRTWGFHVRECYGLQGPVSLACGFLPRLAALAGRQDLVDRLFAEMRQTLVVRGWSVRWSSLSVICGRRENRSTDGG